MIKFSREEKDRFVRDIQYYFETERDEEIGMIAAESLYDFFIETIGKKIYNRAVDDTRIWTEKRFEEVMLDVELLHK